jgi:hypothetical protein
LSQFAGLPGEAETTLQYSLSPVDWSNGGLVKKVSRTNGFSCEMPTKAESASGL